MQLKEQNNTSYPRVLLIYNSRINKADQHGVSIRAWFSDWPKDHLAQIYSGGEVGTEVFCGHNFKIGQNERRLGKYFLKLKGSSIGQSSYNLPVDKNFTKLNKLSISTLLKNKIGEWLLNTGLWEFIFKPVLSERMKDFINDFAPDIIYCQGYTLSFTWLPVMIYKKYKLPICFQTGDDWATYLYRDSPLSFAIIPVIMRSLRTLVDIARLRIANGTPMAKEYSNTYKVPFEVIMMCDSIKRFKDAAPKRVVDENTISIVYTGGLAFDRWHAIVEVCQAARLLEVTGKTIMVTIFATLVPPEAVSSLKKIENLQIYPGPSHEDLPSFLKGADILFLPETFNEATANSFRLSISTKAHLYMMSEKPILVYAPLVTGIMDYANQEGWACMVQHHSITELSNGLQLLITDKDYSKRIVDRGIEVASKNHDEMIVKAKFLNLLNKAIELPVC